MAPQPFPTALLLLLIHSMVRLYETLAVHRFSACERLTAYNFLAGVPAAHSPCSVWIRKWPLNMVKKKIHSFIGWGCVGKDVYVNVLNIFVKYFSSNVCIFLTPSGIAFYVATVLTDTRPRRPRAGAVGPRGDP